MEMDMGTLLVVAIAVALFALPFILTIRSRKKKQRKLLQSLAAMADRYNSSIGQREFCGNYAIGMDPEGRFVFFEKKLKDRVEEQTVALSEVKQCKPVNIGKNVGTERTIESLGLKFVPKDTGKPEQYLEFFNHEQSFQLSGELQSMEAWSQRINAGLKGA